MAAVPEILELGDMSDLAGLIEPRGLVAGRKDELANFEGVREEYERTREYYGNQIDRLRLVVGDGGHRFYPVAVWPVIDTVEDQLRW